MAPSRHADEGGKLQLTETNRVGEEEECFDSIDKLISQGINSGDVKKLQDAGIYTCNDLMMHPKKSLTGIKGLSEAKVDKICEAAEKLLSQDFMTRSDLLLKKSGSQAHDEPVMGATLGTVVGFLVKHIPDRKTLMKKNYEQEPQQITETIEKRLGGYQKICMYGLGFVFWGAASGVLDKLDTSLVHLFTIYFTISLILMLQGLSATLFPSSTPLALGTASLGAWTAYVYILATFHIASLKFHLHIYHCVWSMVISTIVLTLHWGYSAQEPVIIHIFSKLALGCVFFVLWVIVICLEKVLNFACIKSYKQENTSLKEHLLRSNGGNNTRTWGWRSLTNV